MEERDQSEPLEPSQSSEQFFASAVLFELGLAVVALFLGWLFEHSPLLSVTEPSWDSWRETWPEHARAAGWGVLATLPMLVGLWGVERLPLRPLEDLSEFVERRMVPLFQDCTWWQLAVIALLAGVGEEMLFRGWLQTILVRWIDGSSAVPFALIAASVAFGLCHALSRTYFVLATLIGFYLGGWFLWTGNLFTPIVAHALYDFLALIYLVRRKSSESESGEESEEERTPEGTSG